MRHAGNGIRSGRAGRGMYQTIRDRAMQRGLLGILGGRIVGVGVRGEPDGLGGSARGIDRAISGLRGLAAGIEGSGRRSMGAVAGLGTGDYGDGAGSGEGCCGDIGIDDLMSQEAPLRLDHKAQTVRAIAPDLHIIKDNWAPISGGRNSAEIMRVVRQNLASLRHAYNRYLRQGNAIAGKITVEFAIDGSGKVVSCRIVNSTIDNSRLEAEIMGIISRWLFERIDIPGDITVAVYPFSFSS
jgi:TonB family protein